MIKRVKVVNSVPSNDFVGGQARLVGLSALPENLARYKCIHMSKMWGYISIYLGIYLDLIIF